MARRGRLQEREVTVTCMKHLPTPGERGAYRVRFTHHLSEVGGTQVFVVGGRDSNPREASGGLPARDYCWKGGGGAPREMSRRVYFGEVGEVAFPAEGVTAEPPAWPCGKVQASGLELGGPPTPLGTVPTSAPRRKMKGAWRPGQRGYPRQNTKCHTRVRGSLPSGLLFSLRIVKGQGRNPGHG